MAKNKKPVSYDGLFSLLLILAINPIDRGYCAGQYGVWPATDIYHHRMRVDPHVAINGCKNIKIMNGIIFG